MKVKELQRTVNISWSPAQVHPVMLAAGTAAQQLDSSFSTNAALELYSLNLSEPGLDLELKASAPSAERFHKVVWGAHGVTGSQPNGVIVGGCEGGLLQIYSASKLLAGEDAVLAKQDKHTGAVRALDLNPFQMNLLASGASESEIYIWDLNNTDTPMSPGTKSQPMEDVQCVAWNRQVQHILASSFATRCVVWDLRKNEPIIKLSDSQSRLRWGSVCWHPSVATQLCLASEEDQAPVIQMWDLRFATSPLKVLQRHQRGVLSLSWSPTDPDLLLSCGKDNNLFCWNAASEIPGGEIVSELPCSTQWNFNVSWCPKNPSLFTTTSFDGYVSVHTVMGGSQQQVQTSQKIADSFPGMDTMNVSQVSHPVSHQPGANVSHNRDPTKTPKWLKKPVGAKFGFGGKLVSFDQTAPGQVHISQLITETELVSRSQQLEQAVHTGSYVDYCLKKADESGDQHVRYVWYFLKAGFENDVRTEILNLLGYKLEDMANKLNKYVTSANPTNENAVDNLTDQMAGLSRSESSECEPEQSSETENSTDNSVADGSAAFDAIAAGNKNIDQTTKDTNKSNTDFKINTSDDREGLISQAILSGNTEAAVELCIEAGRMADAIVIAITGGSELLARTQYRYLQQSSGSLSVLISSLITEDWTSVVQQCHLDSWKQALVGLLTHCNNNELLGQCAQLGNRLEASGRLDAAMLCYIVAGDAASLVRVTTGQNSSDQNNSDQNTSTGRGLVDAVELVTVLQAAARNRGQNTETSSALNSLLTRYSLLLAGQGCLEAALTHLGESQSEDIVELRDRLHCALGLKNPYGQISNAMPHSGQQPSRSHTGNAVPLVTNTMSYQATPPQTGQYQQNTMFNTGLPGQTPVQPSWQSQQQQPLQPQPVQPSPVSGGFLNPVQQTQPAMSSGFLNPGQAPVVAQPPPLAAPPRPGSVGSSHGSTVGTRSKYVLDPSVQSSNTFPNNSYNSPASLNNPVYNNNTSMYNTVPQQQQMVNSNPGLGYAQPGLVGNNPSQTQPAMLNPMQPLQPGISQQFNQPQQPGYNQQQPGFNQPLSTGVLNPGLHQQQVPTSSYGNTMLQPGVQEPPLPPPPTSRQTGPTPPPGWNDPPMVSSSRRQSTKQQEYQTSSPITHPLFGNQDPNPGQQNQYGVPLTPSGPGLTQFNTGLPQQQNYQPMQQQQQQAQQSYNGYGDIQQQPQFNLNPGQTNGVPRNVNPGQQDLQQQQYQQQQEVVAPKLPPQPVPKAPLPEEHVYLQVVLDELRNKCAEAAGNPQLKRKLDDVAKKLEALYDMLRDNRLSPNTLQVLHQMVQMIQIGDYAGGIGLHTALVSGPDFAQIACFMPGLKVLLLSASQLQVVLR